MGNEYPNFPFLSKDADQHNQIERHVWYDAQGEWMTTQFERLDSIDESRLEITTPC